MAFGTEPSVAVRPPTEAGAERGYKSVMSLGSKPGSWHGGAHPLGLRSSVTVTRHFDKDIWRERGQSFMRNFRKRALYNRLRGAVGALASVYLRTRKGDAWFSTPERRRAVEGAM